MSQHRFIQVVASALSVFDWVVTAAELRFQPKPVSLQPKQVLLIVYPGWDLSGNRCLRGRWESLRWAAPAGLPGEGAAATAGDPGAVSALKFGLMTIMIV